LLYSTGRLKLGANRTLTRYQDLSDEEKANVILGFVLAATFLPSFIFFTFFFIDQSQIDKLWASGMSLFGIARIIVPPMYLIFCLPMSISVSLAAAILRRRISYLTVGLGILLSVGAFFLFAYLLLLLFDIFLSNLSIAFQWLLVLSSFFILGTLLMLAIKTPKINKYIGKILRQ
jgi:hypothetical protein